MSAKQRDSGSKIEAYAAKPSAYDSLYSSGGDDDATKQAARDRKQAAANNRHLRWASSHGDLRATLRLDENAKLPGNRNGGGVGDALENQSRDEKTGEGRTREGLILEEQARKRAAAELGNNSPVSPPVPVPGGAAAPAGGTGTAPYTPIPNAKPSTSSPLPSAGQSATPGSTTPPVAQGGAGNGKPAVPEWQQKRTAALEALRGKFTEQDAANALAKETEPKGIDPLYQASEKEMAEPQTDSRMPTLSAKELTPEEAEKSRLEESRRSFSEKFPSLGDENINAMKALADKIKSPSAKSPEQIKKEETSRQSAEYRKIEIEIADKEQESRKSRIAYLDGVTQNLEYGSKGHSYDDMATGVTGNRIISKTNDSLKKEARSPDQASVDNKLQKREAAYRAPVNDVLDRSNFLQRFSVTV